MTNTSEVADRTKGSTPSTGAPTSDNDEQTPLNYCLPPEYYTPIRSRPTASQRSNAPTDSSRSISTSAESYQSRDSYQAASTQATSQYYYRQETSPPPRTPSEKGDRDSKEPQYCWHKDCLDPSGRPTRQFSRKADVARHHKSTHDKQFIDCPRRNCNRKGEHGFTRVDHQIEHLRGYHGEELSIAKRSASHANRAYSRDA